MMKKFGDFALQATETGFLTARQIEAGRVAIARHIKKGGKLWIRVFPDKPLTKKPLETRMGKGKGSPEVWVARVRAGRILYEMEGLTNEGAKRALELASHKLALKTKFVSRENYREA